MPPRLSKGGKTMDIIFNCMDDQMRLELFQSNNRHTIYKLLIKSIENIETVEDVKEGFGEVYNHIFEGIQEDEVTLCSYDNKVYTFDRIKLESFVRYNYDIPLKEFMNHYTYDDAEEIKFYMSLQFS